MAPDGAANVIVSTEPVSEALTSHDYAMAQGRQLEAEFADYAELSLTAQPVAGVPGYVRRLRWQPPDGVPVFQVQAYAVLEPGRALVGTATTALASMERLEAELQKILDSIALGD